MFSHMNDHTLPADKLAELRATHREARDKREADRIKTVVLLATGWSSEQVADVLEVDANTVRNHVKRYRQGGVKTSGHVAFRGSACALDEGQLALLGAHLQTPSTRWPRPSRVGSKSSSACATPKAA